jgi:hypothetical protein
MTLLIKDMTGLVIDRKIQQRAPYKPVATVRIFRGGIFVNDIQLQDTDQWLPVGKMFTISFEEIA